MPIWNFGSPKGKRGHGEWKSHLTTKGAKAMTHFYNFLQTFPGMIVTPLERNNILSGSHSKDIRAFGSKSKSYAAIINTRSGPLKVDMGFFGKTVHANWFDPTNGKYKKIEGSPLQNSGVKSFEWPGKILLETTIGY